MQESNGDTTVINSASSHSPLEVALFPIPNMVAFPGTKVPLHVFEQRYRAMIHDCVRDQRMLAISHTRKQISDNKPHQDLTEVLKQKPGQL